MNEILLRLIIFLINKIDSMQSSIDSTKIIKVNNFVLPTWIKTILISVCAGLIGFFLQHLIRKIFFRKPPFDGIVKKIKDIIPADFHAEKPGNLNISEKEYIEIYALRPHDNDIKKAIFDGKNVLIYGVPLQGKSRIAFQVLNSIKYNLKGYWFVRPDIKPDIRNVPNKKKTIAFLDDLNKYADVKFDLLGFLRQFKNPPIIIATCRLGDEQIKACNHFGNALDIFENITLENITPEQAQEIAEKTHTNTNEFNGTPGSVTIGLEKRIRPKMNALNDNQKAILRALSLLAKCSIYRCKYSVLNAVSIEIFTVDNVSFENNLKILKETGLIIESGNIIEILHDKYFEFIDYHFNNNDINKLTEILLNLKESVYLMGLSVWCEKNKNYEKMIEICSKVINYDSNFVLAYLGRGLAYGKKGDFDKEIVDYTKAIEINPNDASVYYNRGFAYGHKGEFDKAIEDYTKAIEINPKYADAYNNRGVAYDNKGEFDKAIADFSRTIEINPNLAQAYYNRGNTYVNKGKFDKAIADYSKAIEINPKYAEAYNNRGCTYCNNKECDKGIEDFTKAVEINPKYAKAMAMMGRAYQQKGNKEKARYWYEKALKYKDQLTPEQIQEVQKWLEELEGK